VVNEILTMLPPAMRQTIHGLFILVWATGITTKAWKTSEMVLIDKGKGEETDLSTYRPVGLANTLYKLWARMVTNTEFAESNSLQQHHTKRKQKDTIHQLQNIMAMDQEGASSLFCRPQFPKISQFSSWDETLIL